MAFRTHTEEKKESVAMVPQETFFVLALWSSESELQGGASVRSGHFLATDGPC